MGESLNGSLVPIPANQDALRLAAKALDAFGAVNQGLGYAPDDAQRRRTGKATRPRLERRLRPRTKSRMQQAVTAKAMHPRQVPLMLRK